MEDLIKEWEKSADKYQELGLIDGVEPVRQEGLLCRSEVYRYCAEQLRQYAKDKFVMDVSPANVKKLEKWLNDIEGSPHENPERKIP